MAFGIEPSAERGRRKGSVILKRLHAAWPRRDYDNALTGFPRLTPCGAVGTIRDAPPIAVPLVKETSHEPTPDLNER